MERKNRKKLDLAQLYVLSEMLKNPSRWSISGMARYLGVSTTAIRNHINQCSDDTQILLQRIKTRRINEESGTAAEEEATDK